MPQLKYKFVKALNTQPPSVELEKLPNHQIFGRPKGQEFTANEEEVRHILAEARGFYRNDPNADNNIQEMSKALRAINLEP